MDNVTSIILLIDKQVNSSPNVFRPRLYIYLCNMLCQIYGVLFNLPMYNYH